MTILDSRFILITDLTKALYHGIIDEIQRVCNVIGPDLISQFQSISHQYEVPFSVFSKIIFIDVLLMSLLLDW